MVWQKHTTTQQSLVLPAGAIDAMTVTGSHCATSFSTTSLVQYLFVLISKSSHGASCSHANNLLPQGTSVQAVELLGCRATLNQWAAQRAAMGVGPYHNRMESADGDIGGADGRGAGFSGLPLAQPIWHLW